MQPINEKVYIAGQINADDFTEIKSLGIEQIICNRPDGESEDQSPSEAIKSLAEAAGIAFIYAPVIPGNSPEPILPDVKQALDTDKKTLMYCKSGMRAVIVWSLLEAAQGKNVDQLIDQAAQLGYGTGQLKGFIETYANSQRDL